MEEAQIARAIDLTAGQTGHLMIKGPITLVKCELNSLQDIERSFKIPLNHPVTDQYEYFFRAVFREFSNHPSSSGELDSFIIKFHRVTGLRSPLKAISRLFPPEIENLLVHLNDPLLKSSCVLNWSQSQEKRDKLAVVSTT